MAPFKKLLSPKTKFAWTEELDAAFERSKVEIIKEIQKGVEIFDPKRRTCLRTDWSKTGISFYLSQKHCNCQLMSPGCCDDGWRITLAGSRFMRPAESRHAPVEGEALAICWALEQTRYFTQGCDNLLVITDHKPLVKIFGDRLLDEISNPRIFSLKQRTLMWRFDIDHRYGKNNHFANATSRYPTNDNEIDNVTSALCCIRITKDEYDDMESDLTLIAAKTTEEIRCNTWDLVKQQYMYALQQNCTISLSTACHRTPYTHYSLRSYLLRLLLPQKLALPCGC